MEIKLGSWQKEESNLPVSLAMEDVAGDEKEWLPMLVCAAQRVMKLSR